MKMNDKTVMKQKHRAKNVVSIVIQRSIHVLGINNSVYSVVYYSHGLGACVCVCVRVRACVRVHSFDQ